MRYADLTGTKFGLLTAVEYAGNTKRGLATWRCVCECGGQKITTADNLRRGSTRSCGCLGVKQRRDAAQGQQHPLSKSNKPREYNAWEGMLRRCYDPKHPSFKRYGAKGFAVCDRWRSSFAAFHADMGDVPAKHTLDRIDNTVGYEPGNCRWATMKDQANNRSNNRLLTFNGKTMNTQQWSDLLGWHKGVVTSRLRYGWPVERALTETPRKRNHA